jgi:hypothetical protein
MRIDSASLKCMTSRKDQLAEFGETRACHLLRNEGFVVERMPRNFHFFDLMATRASCRLLVAVKTRINTTSKGKIKKNAYNLYIKPGHHEAAKKIANFARARIWWIAVTVDAKAKTFSGYMGDVTSLASATRIPMHPERDLHKHKCLTKNQPDNEILATWSNVVGTVSM